MSQEFDLEKLFKTDNVSRDKFLSRLFGIFNEEFIRIWCRDEKSPYLDLGRPTVYLSPNERGSTLDFCLKNRKSGKIYITEMKCELQYQNYKYLTLSDHSQLDHHNKNAFKKFLYAAKHPADVLVKVGGNPIKINGGILIWGRIAQQAYQGLKVSYNLADIISLELAIKDLQNWKNKEYQELIATISNYCNYFFGGLTDVEK